MHFLFVSGNTQLLIEHSLFLGSDNSSNRLIVQFLAGPYAELLTGLDCTFTGYCCKAFLKLRDLWTRYACPVPVHRLATSMPISLSNSQPD